MAFISGPALPTARVNRTVAATPVRMASGEDTPVVSRRALLSSTLAAAAAALLSAAAPAKADREYGNVGFLGGGDKIDVNNANVRVYGRLPGMYPTLAGLIVANGPYKSVGDLYNIPGLDDKQTGLLKKYEDSFVALEPRPEYEIDKFNNGLYR
uniref:Photosystem II extrinsic protein U, chloroplastic n=1 Tax=Griffithsia japonica TaxID=83288 RepID=PSBU_GRIJA|nr:RecName: Full=Photosystem II extrinsic protein U, chloroplastic; Short=PsbU; AltName: Full=Photosystem II 12 kDa extrinsic protein; Short=PS II complex 12 kDa extrinsic protein; Flags: Precursor [Griffithsia japonica]AAP80721.1 photosystem II 12kD extrinsic protein [Griffithsia japonica]|eukprot:GO256000.1.p1 GENE.GO256000.1~~GO256000.1.p1  ORF type:complete len:163 (+),score=60.41 GO256000.1:29-490(+)